jgi:hypothetical protein
MLNENNPLLEINLTKQKSSFNDFCYSIIETFYALFDLIVEDAIENFWYEFVIIFSGYMQLFCFLLDSTVSILNILMKINDSFIRFGNKMIF